MHSLSILAVLGLAAVGYGQSVSLVTGFTGSPTALKMYAYVPPNLVKPAPIVVGIHHCQGNGQEYSTESGLLPLAASHNFIAIFPSSKSSGGCFDVSSTATLTHNGGGDSQTIANMITYAITNYGGDSSRVYLTGSSSGAMMTNVMAGAYPDMIQACSVYSGVPDGCFYVAGATATEDPPAWNSQCSGGTEIKSAEEWGDMVRSYYPGYTGARPRMQIWHGTADTTLYYPNYAETLKQWSNVFGLSNPVNTTNTPFSGYTRSIYGSGDQNTAQLVGYSAQGVGHTVPIDVTQDLAFFGVGTGTGTSPGGSTTTTMKTTTTAGATPTSNPGGCSVALYGQCGGTGFTGCTVCASGSTCKVSNDYYSQCL